MDGIRDQLASLLAEVGGGIERRSWAAVKAVRSSCVAMGGGRWSQVVCEHGGGIPQRRSLATRGRRTEKKQSGLIEDAEIPDLCSNFYYLVLFVRKLCFLSQ